MSEYNADRVSETTIKVVKRNEQMRSWVYALAGMMFMLWGMQSYPENTPYLAIAGIICSFASVQAGRKTEKFNAKYVAAAVICGCVLEIINGFMF